MKRTVLALLCCALVTVPVAAQEGPRPAIDLRKIAFDAAKATAPGQATQTPPPRTSPSGNRTAGEAAIYAISLGAAAAGTIYDIQQTREALDRKLQVRTFPLVWIKTSDPADKGKMTGLIGGVNGGLMVLSAFAYKAHNTKTATLINVVVAAATIGVGLHAHSVISDDKKACPIVSVCR